MNRSFKKLVLFTAFITLLLHIANKVIFMLALVKELLSTKEGHFYKWKHGTVFYTKEGSGSPILLIHDLQADSSGYEWSRIKKELAKTHTVYTPDLLGCGRSEKPSITYTSFMYVQFLDSFIREVIKEPVQVAATGSSSTFVLLAASQNNQIKMVSLINPLSFSGQSSLSPKKARLYKFLVSVPVFGTCIYNHSVSMYQIQEKFHDEYFYNKHICPGKYISAYYEAAHMGGSSSRYLFASIAAGFTNLPVRHVLHKISIPVQIISGGERSGSREISDAYQNILPNASAKIIYHTKKLPQLEKPDEILSLLN